jgi:hypothetical protein
MTDESRTAFSCRLRNMVKLKIQQRTPKNAVAFFARSRIAKWQHKGNFSFLNRATWHYCRVIVKRMVLGNHPVRSRGICQKRRVLSLSLCSTSFLCDLLLDVVRVPLQASRNDVTGSSQHGQANRHQGQDGDPELPVTRQGPDVGQGVGDAGGDVHNLFRG